MMLLVGVAFSGVLTFVANHAATSDRGAAVGGFFVVYSGRGAPHAGHRTARLDARGLRPQGGLRR